MATAQRGALHPPSRSCVVSSVHINLPLLGHDVAILFAIPVITPHLITPHGSGQAQTQEHSKINDPKSLPSR